MEPASVFDFFAPLTAVLPQVAVELRGEWSTSVRRTYASPGQQGSGEGPYREVEDAFWRGVLECAVPLAGLAILRTPGRAAWARSHPATLTPPVELSLHSWVGDRQVGATFASNLHGGYLPGVPVPCGPDLTAGVTLSSGRLVTGSVHQLAAVQGAELLVLLLPGSALKVGRNRIWHLRDELASPLPAELRQVLTRRRSGVLPLPGFREDPVDG